MKYKIFVFFQLFSVEIPTWKLEISWSGRRFQDFSMRAIDSCIKIPLMSHFGRKIFWKMFAKNDQMAVFWNTLYNLLIPIWPLAPPPLPPNPAQLWVMSIIEPTTRKAMVTHDEIIVNFLTICFKILLFIYYFFHNDFFWFYCGILSINIAICENLFKFDKDFNSTINLQPLHLFDCLFWRTAQKVVKVLKCCNVTKTFIFSLK
jgi:hypothetical protein